MMNKYAFETVFLLAFNSLFVKTNGIFRTSIE